MSKVRYNRKQSSSFVPRMVDDAKESLELKRASHLDLWRRVRMTHPDYHSLTNKELRRMDRLEAIKKAATAPQYAKTYPESLVEVLPPAPDQRQPSYMRKRQKHSGGKMS